MELLIDTRRVNLIFARLLAASNAGAWPFVPANLDKRPQAKVPASLHSNANFWFYFTHLMRGMMKSDYAAGQVVKLYELNPDLFTPEHAVTLTAEEIDAELGRVFTKVPSWQKFGEAWQRNSEILLAWGGNILNVYDGVTTEAEVRKRIVNKLKYNLPLKERGFYMFREKMCSLLTYFLIDAKLIAPIRMSPPVDFHHMRALIGTRMLALTEGVYRPEKVAKVGDQLCQEYLKRFPEMNPVMFAELLFILSRESCANAVSEPEPDWTDVGTILAYKNSCGRCDLNDKCTHTIVTGEYYRSGYKPGRRVIKVIPRPTPPRHLR